MKRKNNLPPPKKLKMQANHTWQAPDGYKIVVLDRGAVSFNVPTEWHLTSMEPLELNDKEPPDDDARITVSFWRLPPGIDWTELPLPKLLRESAKDSGKVEVLEYGPIEIPARTDIEQAWMYKRFIDPAEKREAFTRIALARGWDVQVLVTSDFWVDDLHRMIPIWDELLRSMQLGRVIEDPTKGVVLN
jgi:hypothetical protein